MKKWMTAVTAAVSAVTMLVGCSPEPAKEPAKEPASAAKPDNGGAKPSLKILANYAANLDPNKDVMVADLEKATGYKAEFFMLPQQKPEEKLNIEIASGADYDIIKLTPTQFYTLAAQGALLPLDELINRYGANMKKALLPESWDLAKLGGKTYGIPQKNERPQVGALLQIRQDLLDGLGLKTPETADELYNALKQLKAKYPDKIPFTGSSSDSYVNPTIGSAFQLYNEWTDINGKLVPRIQMPQIKDYFAYMTKLYKEGLIDPDWAINKTTSAEEKYVSGKALMMNVGYTPATRIVPAVMKNNAGAKLAYIQPLKDASGAAGIQADYKLNYVSAVPKSAKHPEDAVKYLDTKLEENNFEFLAIGPKGETFNLENGKYIPIMPAFTDRRNNGYWYLNGIDEHRYPDMWLARLRRDPNLFAAFEEMNKNTAVFKTDPTSLMPPIDEVSKNIQALKKLEQDYFIKLLMGEEKLDGYAAFISQWNSEGGAEMIKAVNNWYQSSKK
ncbi:extracellular solute-binding protein [Paenibacillus thalictri]|uniref:Extracellular solute-binding protein n=1 Tax=Paenibacillus thalictri TaxID=2527873 RepID=A0A4Q9DJF9_9BACL|nr:extracellular solute-binding protein [Paenibacillus thalictri]TBL70727.1 extracellular solute-binding protein [Paenibacillus thalictri]